MSASYDYRVAYRVGAAGVHQVYTRHQALTAAKIRLGQMRDKERKLIAQPSMPLCTWWIEHKTSYGLWVPVPCESIPVLGSCVRTAALALLAVLVMACAGCQHRSIADGTVQLAPHTYAMDPQAFDAWALNHGHRQDVPIRTFSITDQCGGCFKPYPNTLDTDRAHMDLEGLTVWKPHGATICVIRCFDPHHLAYSDQLKLIHEMGHREDFFLGSEGASHYWRVLAMCRDGQFFLTHPEINAVLRREGFKAP